MKVKERNRQEKKQKWEVKKTKRKGYQRKTGNNITSTQTMRENK